MDLRPGGVLRRGCPCHSNGCLGFRQFAGAVFSHTPDSHTRSTHRGHLRIAFQAVYLCLDPRLLCEYDGPGTASHPGHPERLSSFRLLLNRGPAVMRGSPSWRPEVGLMERDASVQKTTRVGVAVAQ